MLNFACLSMIIFCVFPFTKILPINSYNQPYAAGLGLFILLFFPSVFFKLPKNDQLMLVYMAAIGLVLFFIAMIADPTLQVVQYLLSYLSPIIIVPGVVLSLDRDADTVRKLIVWSILVWITVGVVQIIVNPSFLTFLATNTSDLGQTVALSGRGMLGLAPEPTHFGLHLLILAGTLQILRGPVWVVGAALAGAIFVAMSSFALLVLFFGSIIWTLTNPKRWALFFLLVFSVSFILQWSLYFFEPESRIAILIATINEGGAYVLLEDPSANSRIFGMISPVFEMSSRWFLPLGMVHEDWLNMRQEILTSNREINFLVEYGPASGYGFLIVQAGFFAFPVLLYFYRRIALFDTSSLRGLLPTVAFTVFFGQIYLATPSFALLLAAGIFEQKIKRSRVKCL